MLHNAALYTNTCCLHTEYSNNIHTATVKGKKPQAEVTNHCQASHPITSGALTETATGGRGVCGELETAQREGAGFGKEVRRDQEKNSQLEGVIWRVGIF